MSAHVSQPRFSILVAAWNVAKTIDRCIGSIVDARKHRDIELIIMDDGSTDETAEICAGYVRAHPWIRLVRQENAGVAEVRNRLLREAAGMYLAFVDGDDAIEPDYFDVIDGKLREPAVDLVVFGHNRTELSGRTSQRPNRPADLGRDDIARMQLSVAENARIYMLCWARLFSRQLAEGFVFDRRIILGEDTAFAIHLMARARRALVIPDCLYNYYETPGSASSAAYKPALLESFEAHYAARLRVHDWPAEGTADLAVLKASIALTYVEYVLLYLLNNIRYLPVGEQLAELKRIRNSVIYRESAPFYERRSPHRGVRFLVSKFIAERYAVTMFGIWIAGLLASLRLAGFPGIFRWQGPDAFPASLGSRLESVPQASDESLVIPGRNWWRRVWAMLKESEFVRNVAAVATGIAAAQAIALVFMPFLTRMYGPSAFGAQAAFAAILNIITPLATLGYANAIVMPKTDAGASAVARLSLLSSAVVAPLAFVLVFLLKPQLARWTGLEDAPGLLYLIPVALLVSALLSVANQAAVREGLFRAKARSYVASTLLSNIGKFAGGLLSPSGLLLIVLTLAGSVMNYVMLLARVPRSGVFRVRHWFGLAGVREAAREHRDFVLYRMPHSIINAASLGLPVIVLTSLHGAAVAGQYSISVLALGAPVTLLGQSVYEVFFPRITRAVQSGQESAAAIIGKTTIGLVLVSVIPFGAIALFGDRVFPFVFGAEWTRAGEFSQWVALWMAASLATRPAVAAIPVLGRQGMLLAYEIVMTVGRVAALYAGQRVGDDLTSIAFFVIVNIVGYAALLLLVFASLPKRNGIQNA